MVLIKKITLHSNSVLTSMRCKKHLSDFSSSLGVCASCLRERLFSLIAAQVQLSPVCSRAEDLRSKSDLHPRLLAFPCSVSPYIYRRKFNDAACDNDDLHYNNRRHRFYSTPQVGPTYSSTTIFVSTDSLRMKQKSRFSLWSRLFHFRSEKFDSDPRVYSQDSFEPASSTSTSSPSWFSSMLSGRKKRPSKLSSLKDPIAVGGRRPCQMFDRGMSPAESAGSDEDEEYHCDQTPSASGYSSESSQNWRRSPTVAQGSARRWRSGHNRNLSGIAFCLSPLVRASPNRHRHRHQKGLLPEVTFSGEVRVPVKPHFSGATSFCANRSRKLAVSEESIATVDFDSILHLI